MDKGKGEKSYFWNPNMKIKRISQNAGAILDRGTTRRRSLGPKTKGRDVGLLQGMVN